MKKEIYTIGYGNRSWEKFLQLLKDYRINTIIDIRTKPFSRFNPNFRRKALESNLLSNHINYIFMGETLGGKPKEDVYVNGKLSFELVEKTESYKKGIDNLLKIIDSSKNICLMCAELKPTDCHRHTTVGRTLTGLGFKVLQIEKDESLSIQKNSQQSTLF